MRWRPEKWLGYGCAVSFLFPNAVRTASGTLLAFALLLSLAERLALASPSDLFGSGAESIGRAGTGVAAASGPAVTHLNPALLAGGGVASLRLGYRAADFDLRGQTPNSRFDLGDGSGAL